MADLVAQEKPGSMKDADEALTLVEKMLSSSLCLACIHAVFSVSVIHKGRELVLKTRFCGGMLKE